MEGWTAMTKVMILEDSMDSLMALTAMIKKISKDIAVVPVESLEKARAALQDEANLFQAFLLDINLDEQDMEDASGMEFARQVRNDIRYAFTPLVMITSIANLELAAYRELHCYQYILKPYDEEEIEKLIHKVLFQTGESKEPFVLVKKEGVNYKIYCKDIVYLYAIPRGICLVLQKETMKIPYLSIKQILAKLPEEQFIQCHTAKHACTAAKGCRKKMPPDILFCITSYDCVSGKTTVTVLTVTETSANHAEQIKQDNEPGTGYDGKSILQIRRIPV